ncbi:MAG: HD domain-containing phosphohydrolase [Clostridiaceae bacterium]
MIKEYVFSILILLILILVEAVTTNLIIKGLAFILVVFFLYKINIKIKKNKDILDNLPSGIVAYDVKNNGEKGEDYKIKYYNKVAFSEDEKTQGILGKKLIDIRPNIDGSQIIKGFKKVWDSGETLFVEATKYEDEKYDNWYENYVAKLDNGDIISIFNDVTKYKKIESKIKESELKFRHYFEEVPNGIFIADNNGMFVEVNNKTSEITGYSKDELLKMNLFNLILDEEQQKSKNLYSNVVKSGRGEGIISFIKKGKEKRICYIKSIKLSKYEMVGIVEDITEKEINKKKIEYLSFHDTLTGLYNRRFFQEEMNRLDINKNYPLTIVMADLNGLKLINDAFGHLTGDQFIIKAADIIKKYFRQEDIVCRWGGDEFVIILPNTKEEEAEKIVDRINCEILKQDKLNGVLSISFGWAEKENKDQKLEKIFIMAEEYMYKKKMNDSNSLRGENIKTIISTLYEKSPREKEHSERVRDLATKLAIKFNMSKSEIESISAMSLLHDIGKIIIPHSILEKPGKLTDDEWTEMKKHPEIGYRIIGSSHEMGKLTKGILHHHERYDGKGYPDGIKGNEIPIESRIISLADCYDAMTEERPYKKSLTKVQAIKEIEVNAGKQFDPVLAKVFIEKVLGTVQ